MKKIEKIIENCIDCPSCGLYKRTREQEWGQIAVCHEYDRVLFMASETDLLDDLSIPDWCPLETYKEAEKSEVQPAAPAVNRSTIILSGLEWAPANLMGHGGTEVDGRWYYTWEQAMAAAAELGDGWRLPTAAEFEALCNLGSTWDGNGPDGMPGRWFGGNHATDHAGSLFLPVSGFRNLANGSLSSVGSGGWSWSSSPYSAGSQNAGYLYFNASSVNSFISNNRANGFTVRCVREIRERI